MKTRLIKIIFIMICITVILENCALAAYNVKGLFSGTSSSDDNISSAATSAQNILFNILDAVRIVGVAVAVVILMYVAIKFMTAAPSERANIKQYLINYVIGAAILFGASGLVTIAQSIAKSAFPGT